MNKKDIKHVLNVLRRGTITWYARGECLAKARVKLKIGKLKNGKDKFRSYFKCSSCKELKQIKEVQVDHIEEVGGFTGDFDEYVRRMYCSEDNLQVLCVNCHVKKTSRFNATTRYKRKK